MTMPVPKRPSVWIGVRIRTEADILTKLGLRNHPALTRYGITAGLIEP